MIGTLTLRNYRGFEEYDLRGLARVNLLVGPNNCGKTSVLEAVELLASDGDPTAMLRSCSRRGESFPHRDRGGRTIQYAVRHHFRGHDAAPGTWLSVSSDDHLGKIEMRVRPASSKDDPRLFEAGPPETHLAAGAWRPLVLELRRERRSSADAEPQRFPLTSEGAIAWRSSHLPFLHLPYLPEPFVPIRFLTADSRSDDELRAAWNQVVLDGKEDEIVEAMRVIAPDLRSIRLLAGDGRTGRSGSPQSGFVLGQRGGGRRTPIGSHGEGMRRLLALSLSLADIHDGFLLIDEIDTGLHWTVMADMWRLVIETSRCSATQVLASTHSLDCIRGLASLLDKRPDLTDEVAVHKLERRIGRSARFGAGEILAATDLDIELR